MNKKVMALAVAGALSAPVAALAQVQIGGGINLLYFAHDPDNDSAASSSDVMQSSESELRISGTDKLGGGTEAWFQCATSIDGIINGNTATTAGMCTRNSALGFKGSFGNVFIGNWDTPTKLLQNRIRGWFSGTNALYGGGYTLLGGGASSGNGNNSTGTAYPAGGAAAYSMYRRQANSVNYQSPNWSGFSVAAAFSAANEAATIPDSVGLTPRMYGLNAMYATGPFWVGASYEAHTDYNPASQAIGNGASQYNGGTDDNITIGVGYTFMGTLNVRATYSDTKYEATNNGDLKAKGYGAYVDWQVSGPHAIHLAWITTDDNGGSTNVAVGPYRNPQLNDTAAQVYTIAYSYDFSKRTQLLFSYNAMDNKNNAAFNQGVAASTVGGKQTSIGAAVRYSF